MKIQLTSYKKFTVSILNVGFVIIKSCKQLVENQYVHETMHYILTVSIINESEGMWRLQRINVIFPKQRKTVNLTILY